MRKAPSVNDDAWKYCGDNGVNIWTWHAKPGVTYRVTQPQRRQMRIIVKQLTGQEDDDAQIINAHAHITTGRSYKLTIGLGTFATVKEACVRCKEHFQHQT